MKQGDLDPENNVGKPGRGIFVVIALALIATYLVIWQQWPATSIPPRMVEGQQTSKTFYRLKASYTYTGKNGPEPLEFDVVAGCALQLTKYITGDVSGMSSRVPTMVAYEMSDGGAIGIAIPKACRGSTTSNGFVPADFLPATIQYESATDLSLGMLYASEDAYDSPLAKLKFHGAGIESATEEEFKAFIASDNFKKNLISIESSKDLGAPNTPITDEMRENPRMSWKYRVPMVCRGVARVAMPERVKEYLGQFWKPGGPRYWMLSAQHSLQMRAWLRGNAEADGEANPLTPPEVTVNGIPFTKYDIEIERTGGGIVTRKGGGSLAARNPRNDFIYYLPPDYFPYKMISAPPWLEKTDEMTRSNRVTVLSQNRFKGFMFCYTNTPTVQVTGYPNAALGYIQPVQNSEIYVDSDRVNINDGAHIKFTFIERMLFFDGDEYIYWAKSFVL
jgi:hypothetical protein